MKQGPNRSTRPPAPVMSLTSAATVVSAAPVDPPPLQAADGREACVVHVVAELAPFARSGGLGEAVNSLARFQAAAGIRTAVIMPLYDAARANAPDIEPVGPAFQVQVGLRREMVRLWKLRPRANPPLGKASVYFIESEEYFARPYIYGPPGSDFPDNARRYACFSMAALAVLPTIAGSDPVLIHVHDWHTALAPVYLRTRYASDERYRRAKVVLSVHNAGFQGHFSPATMVDLGLPPALFNWRQLEWHGQMNMLKGGLVFADAVTTVSPTHAHELRTFAGGFGLDGVFVTLRDRFVGIANGIDQEVWNPATDSLLAANYSLDSLAGKLECRHALQVETGLRPTDEMPIVAMSARLVSQKGLDLILGNPNYFAFDAQFLFLGSGEPRYEAALRAIADRAPNRIVVETRFSDDLEHRVLAGADMCLMPSQYEPCGLTQMRAQRYGTIPIARRVGGLADTIEDGVTGFLFDDYTPDDFTRAVARAIDQFEEPDGWLAMMRAAMTRDFSWSQSATKYLNVYRRVMGSVAGTVTPGV
jgi:starch synthase